MKKKYKLFIYCSILAIVLIVILVCGSVNTSDSEAYGIKPYKLSKQEQHLLQSFNMEYTSQIISFAAPKSAKSLYVNVYTLSKEGIWDKISNGAITLSEDMAQDCRLTGMFTMTLEDNYVINYHINCNGVASYKTEDMQFDTCETQEKLFLTQYNKIELNKEIPVALLIYSNNCMVNSHSLDDFFNPMNLRGDNCLVQAVTLTFCEQ